MSRQIIDSSCYKYDMAAGRPSKLNRSELGLRLYNARKNAGYTQKEVSEILEVTQQSVAFWERKSKSLPADLLCRLAELFNITTDEMLGLAKTAQKTAPIGRLRKCFEDASKLSRRQQEKISEVVEALVGKHSL